MIRLTDAFDSSTIYVNPRNITFVCTSDTPNGKALVGITGAGSPLHVMETPDEVNRLVEDESVWRYNEFSDSLSRELRWLK